MFRRFSAKGNNCFLRLVSVRRSGTKPSHGSNEESDVVRAFRMPDTQEEATLLLQDAFQKWCRVIQQPFAEDKRGISNYLQRLCLHYRRTTPDFFGVPSTLDVLRLATAESYEQVLKIVQEMESRNTPLEKQHYRAAMYALASSSDPDTQRHALTVFAHAKLVNAELVKDEQFITDLLCVLATSNVSPPLFDRWWSWVSGQESQQESSPANQSEDFEVRAPPARAGLTPEGCLHALRWCAGRKDIERSVKVWAVLQRQFAIARKEIPLAAYAQVLQAACGTEYDGGVKKTLIEHLRTRVSNKSLGSLKWRELAPILNAVSLDSALGLVQLFAREDDTKVPVVVWLTLHRRLCNAKRIAEAESLFGFLRRRFQLNREAKQLAVGAMMKMYSSIKDTENTLEIFARHVLETPPGEPAIQPNPGHYVYLLSVADSPQMATELFREATAQGIALPPTAYEICYRTGTGSLRSLEASLPDDRFDAASELDEFLQIPLEADPYHEREQAQRALGKSKVVPAV